MPAAGGAAIKQRLTAKANAINVFLLYSFKRTKTAQNKKVLEAKVQRKVGTDKEN